ncbi:hypothetical protein BCV70DRAFT_197987 [Testicularia cyperi]|uniref:Uncharacterized protein n=1 Tax=Testicularia cyperi TaxID=1882483 RepID=A0A317Y090_9BASI|nr:hypothetical protein BCV70DRAFT_197987 [Testicularia cyperi]
MATYRQAFGAFYGRNFERRPWVTLAVTNGILGVIADGAAQTLERISHRQNLALQVSQAQVDVGPSEPTEKASTSTQLGSETQVKEWDWARSGRFLVFNVGMAPLLAEWNRFLEFRFPLRSASVAGAASAAASAATTAGKVSLRALGKRVAMDQIVFAPFGLALFTGVMGALERQSVQGVQDKFGEMYIPALLANWQIWPLVQLVNFRYMPLKYRVPFVSTVGILWNIGLSLLSQSTRMRAAASLSDSESMKLTAPTTSS